MKSPLQLLFEAIDQLQDEQDMRSQVVPKIGEYFAAKRSGVFFFDQLLADLIKSDRLTPRELQIAELVGLGRTNAQIGKEIWITENSVKQALKRMFRKLEVSSRAEMVAQLSATKYHLSSVKNNALFAEQ